MFENNKNKFFKFSFGTRRKEARLYHDVIQIEQIHSDIIINLDALFPLAHYTRIGIEAIREIKGDAIVTSRPLTAIGVRTADCVPILGYHSQGKVLAVHAGWRGSQSNIFGKTIDYMSQKYALSPKEWNIAIGPAICKKCYEVGADVAESFFAIGAQKQLESNRSEHYLLDLRGVILQQALAGGLKRENIFLNNECTVCNNEKYFSHRVSLCSGQDLGQRNLSWIQMLSHDTFL